MARLMFEFSIIATKAYELALMKNEATAVQLEAWPFREAMPRNPAGWMIQAIENNYDVPRSYLDHKNKQREIQARLNAENNTRSCPICNGEGFRQVRTADYPNGAMRQCSHDPSIEARYGDTDSLPGPSTRTSPNAQNRSKIDSQPIDEKNHEDSSTTS